MQQLHEYDRLLMSGGARAVPVGGGSFWTSLLRRPVSLSGWPWTTSAVAAVAAVLGALAAGLAVDRSIQATQKRRWLGDGVWPYAVAQIVSVFVALFALTWFSGSSSVASVTTVAAIALFFMVQTNFVENVHRLIPN